jgi:hypothetical protein
MAKKKKSKKEKVDLAKKIAVVASFKIGDVQTKPAADKHWTDE